MARNKKDENYDNENSSSVYGRDGIDNYNYNDNLSKQAVGSIFENIDKGTETAYDDAQDTANIVIDTNFDIKNNRQRKQLVNDFFTKGEMEKKNRKSKEPINRDVKRESMSRRPRQVMTDANSAFARDDDTIAVKYVTRGNHQPLTPAMTAKRKNVTMMESQRIPIITDEEIDAYKKEHRTHNEKVVAYANSNKETKPIDYDHYDEYIHSSSTTTDQREIIEALKNEQNEKERALENTLYRLSEENKRYRSIIETTNKQYKKNDAPIRLATEENAEHEEIVEYDEYENIDGFKVYNIEDEDVDLEQFEDEQQLEADEYEVYEEEYADEYEEEYEPEYVEDDVKQHTSHRLNKQKPFIPARNLTETHINKQNKNGIEEDFYDLESDTYVTRKNHHTTGEIKRINSTVATEISLDELDDFAFDNYDTSDMEYLRNAIKERSQAQKMQNLDKQFEEFEKKHRDFGNRKSEQPMQPKQPRPKQGNPKQQRPSNPQQKSPKSKSDSYEYRTRRNPQPRPEQNTSHTASHTARNERLNTASRKMNTQTTSKIKTVELDEGYDYAYESKAKQFAVSLGGNIILLIALVTMFTVNSIKTSEIKKEIENLKFTNEELISQNNKVSEVQLELDYYKGLYEATEEGQASLVDNNTANSVDSQDGEDKVEANKPAAGGTYTVQPGDTLSSISRKVYNDSSQYKKIMTANNLTSDSLSAGQVLIIPE